MLGLRWTALIPSCCLVEIQWHARPAYVQIRDKLKFGIRRTIRITIPTIRGGEHPAWQLSLLKTVVSKSLLMS